MESPKRILLVFLIYLYYCQAYNILVVFPLPSKSHGILGDNIVKHLLNAGHNVTYITPFIERDAHPRLHLIDVSDNKKLFNENSMNVKQIMDKQASYQDADFSTTLLVGMASHTLENSNIQKFIRDSSQKFDLVLSEWMFSDLYSIFAAIFDCPLIWFSTIEPHWIILNLVDGPLNPAYTSDYLKEYVAPLSFIERVQGLWVQIDGLLRKNFKFYYLEEKVYQESVVPVFKEKGRPVPLYDVLRHNVSLVLGNSQIAIGDAVSLPQNYKHIGGYHIDDEVKPLAKDLKTILDNAKHGVIYFSMGSNLKSKDLPKELKQGLLNVFGGLKQTVIWKFEEILPDAPKNVHIVQWAPQQSILAHPNLILFVTHGGLLSVTEAIHFGVPIISIPVFADQFQNSVRAEKKGFGIRVDLSYTMHEDLKIALGKVLGHEKYSKRAKKLSTAYHDRPMKSKDELAHWVGHVVRTGGAHHLRSPALQLPLYQRLYLDLFVLVLIIFVLLSIIVKRISCTIGVKVWNKKEKSI